MAVIESKQRIFDRLNELGFCGGTACSRIGGLGQIYHVDGVGRAVDRERVDSQGVPRRALASNFFPRPSTSRPDPGASSARRYNHPMNAAARIPAYSYDALTAENLFGRCGVTP